MKSLPHDAKRIVFIGDSITYAGRYVAFIESYLKIAHPDENYEIINIGLPSETVSGLSEVGHAGGAFPRPDAKDRLQKSLNFLKPDLIFSCYGMNDGIYLPFDDDRFAAYQQGIKSLHSVVMASGAKLIHITPPDYDARKDKAYSEVLDVYSTWLLAQSYKKQWQVIDTHFPMQKRLQKELVLDANFYYSKDGIHPNREGHWVIAQTILKALGEKPSNTFEKSIKALNPNAQTNQLFDLVYKKQSILKDAYLTHIGHQRPRMKLGLPISEAIAKAQIIESALHDLVVKLRK
jgi:lysophospholipase L1-like esterase